MGILPYLNPDTKAAVVLYHGTIAVLLVVALTIVMVGVAVFIIETIPAHVRRIKQMIREWARKAASFLEQPREART